LFERISPKKSWEGSIGGAVFTIIAAIIIWKIHPVFNVWIWIGMAIVTVVFGTFGDLAESLIKRELGVKDSGKILPGHGGFLDRFDSTLLAAPIVYAYIYYVSLSAL
jgi:phosphatidate cytidylyltransferase